MQESQITVLIVDDHQMFRHGIRSILEETGGFRVVGEAANVVDAIRIADHHRPCVILLDVQLRGLTGLEVLPILRKRHPQTRIVMLSVEMSDEHLFRAVRAGASAYLTKDEAPETIAATITRVAHGNRPISRQVIHRPAVAVRILDRLEDAVTETERTRPAASLSLREFELLDCVVQGYTNRDAGHAMFIDVKTIKNHMSSLLRKVGVRDRTSLVVEAVRRGWISFGASVPVPAPTDSIDGTT